MIWRVHTMWPLPIVVAEASTCAAWGPAWAALFFCLYFCFRIFETTLRGVPNAWRTHFSFSVWHLLSHERIVRVNRGAEDALERFEELKKMEKMKISVASALFPFLAWFVSDVNSETCFEIAKVVFRRWSVVRILIWAQGPLHFPLTVRVFALCPRVHLLVAISRTCTLWRWQTCKPVVCLILSTSFFSFFASEILFCVALSLCVFGVCVSDFLN